MQINVALNVRLQVPKRRHRIDSYDFLTTLYSLLIISMKMGVFWWRLVCNRIKLLYDLFILFRIVIQSQWNLWSIDVLSICITHTHIHIHTLYAYMKCWMNFIRVCQCTLLFLWEYREMDKTKQNVLNIYVVYIYIWCLIGWFLSVYINIW